MRRALSVWLSILLLSGTAINKSTAQATAKPTPLKPGQPIKGWIILTNNVKEGLAVIDRAPEYDINHLQLSHEVIHDLLHVKEPKRLTLAKTLIERAHQKGIQEVVLWDRSLYELEYYPQRFRTGPKGTIDLDNPEFWEWFKNDYRQMLDMVPQIQGLVLTFIETGTRVEEQYSQKLKTNQEKLAAVVNAVASVVIEERNLNLYARTFSYTHEEYNNIVGAIELFKSDKIRLMMKETPHDFFLTHPNDFFAGTIARPTLMEFDTGAEFNGQGIIANTWPQHILDRWSAFLKRDHIMGYAARTDRYGDTRIVGRPSEINLLALKRYFEDRSVKPATIYEEFITKRYGKAAYGEVKAAFENAYDIVTSILYTLGTSTANHSSLNYDPYPSHYARHASGKWFDPPLVTIQHGINQPFHYWTDIMDHLAPRWAKAGGTQLKEVPWVEKNGWLEPVEKMNEAYLNYILTEKEYGVKLAKESAAHIEKAKPHLTKEAYQELSAYFKRTLLTAQLHRAVAAAYFGFRIYAQGQSFQSTDVKNTIAAGLKDILSLTQTMRDYPDPGPVGQWSWMKDTDMALKYYEMITTGSWPAKTAGQETGLNGIKFSVE